MELRWSTLLLGVAATLLATCARALCVVLPLNGDWRVYNRNKSYHLPGVVPGNVYTDLMRAAIIGDAYYRDNDECFAWVGRENWTYSRDFELKEEHTRNRRILLVAHGIDTVATVYVNGVPVGNTDNMFVRYVFDIKQHIKVGHNNISVEFTSAVAYAREQTRAYNRAIPPECPPQRQRGECGVNRLRKSQSSFSWEMAPSFPTQGIWKDIAIETYNTLVIRDMVVRTRRLGGQQTPGKRDKWALIVALFLEVAFTSKASLLLNLVLDDRLTVKKNITVSANNRLEAHYRFRLRIPESLGIQAWWPNGYGDQKLYTLSVSLSRDHDSATITKSVGFRTVDLVQEPLINSTGATFFLRVNGVPLFAKGSIWLPADAFPDRVSRERIEPLLDAAAAAHMNLLRVWGGGLYESDLFYDLADRRGLLVWQDFAFASALYPATPAFLDSIATEARQQVRRLGHHPSLVLWCGNSENELGLAYNWWKLLTSEHREDYIKLYVETLQKVVYEEDLSRPFLGSTPSNGLLSELSGGIHDNPNDALYGDVHYFDYYSPPWSLESVPTPRFCSSFGLVSFPSLETLATAMAPADLVLPFPQALENRMHLAYAGEWKMLHYFARRFFAPLLVSPYEEAGRLIVYVLDDFYRDRPYQLLLQVNLYHYGSTEPKTSLTHKFMMSSLAQAVYVANISELLLASAACKRNNSFFTFRLLNGTDNKTLLSSNFLLLQVPRLAKDISSVTVRVTSVTSNLTAGPETSRAEISGTETTITAPPTTAKPAGGRSSARLKVNHVSGSTPAFGMSTKQLAVHASHGTDVTPEEDEEDDDDEEETEAPAAVVEAKSTVHKVRLSADGVALFVWLSAGKVKGRFSDNGFLMIERQLDLSFTSDLPVTVEQLRGNLTATCLNCRFKQGYSPMADAKA